MYPESAKKNFMATEDAERFSYANEMPEVFDVYACLKFLIKLMDI